MGELEGPEYLRQSRQMAEAWQGQGATPMLMVMPQGDHFSIADELCDPDSAMSRAIQRQMNLA